MKEKLLIVGAGGLGRVVLEHVIKDYDCAFIDDGCEINKQVCGVRVIGYTSQLSVFRKDFHKLVIAIGDNSVRERIYNVATNLGYLIPNVVCGSVYLSSYALIGDGCIFLNNVVIQNGAKVGYGVILNPGVELHHDSTISNFVCIYSNSVVRTNAVVEDRVKIGSNVTIGNNAVVRMDMIVDDGKTVRQ